MKGVGSRRSFEMCDKSCVGVGVGTSSITLYLIIHPPVVSVFFLSKESLRRARHNSTDCVFL